MADHIDRVYQGGDYVGALAGDGPFRPTEYYGPEAEEAGGTPRGREQPAIRVRKGEKVSPSL